MPSVVRSSTPTGLAGIPAVAAGTYSAAAQLKADSTSRNGRVNIAWYDVAGTFLSRSSGGWISVTSAAWVGVQLVAAVAPANTAFMALEIEFDANFGEMFYADQLILSTGSNVTWGPGGFSANAGFILERSIDGGVIWSEVRGATRDALAPIDAGSAVARATVYDRETPLRVLVRYRGYVQTGVAPATTVSAPGSISDLSVDASSWWLRRTDNSSYDLSIRQAAMKMKIGPGAKGVPFHPSGRDKSVVIHGDAPIGASFDLEIWSLFENDFNNIMEILRSKEVLCVQNLHGDVWYVKVTSDIDVEQLRAVAEAGSNYPTRHAYKVTAEVSEVLEP